MKRYWTWALHAAAAAVGLLAVVIFVGLAAPFVAESVRSIGAEFRSAGGESGLIFVESPEVYTRQRLVNDRYLQDAWLRKKLLEIDEPGQVWIDTVRLREDEASLLIGGGAGQAAGTPSELPQVDAAPLSFERKFELQSNARDAIRQMVLENALDDRHDLSGNTVFGLKFDTSVLPGSRTMLDPTVIVRMEANPLERLTTQPAVLAPFFNSSSWSDTSALDPGDLELLRRNDGYFDGWRRNLEDRLNNQRSIEAADLMQCARSTGMNEELMAAVLCAGPDAADAAPPVGASRLATLLAQGPAVDDSLAFVLRIPERSLAVAHGLTRRAQAGAAAHCTIPANAGHTVRDYVAQWQGEVFPLPAPWETLLEIQLNPRLSDEERSCGVELDIQLNPLNVRLMFVPAERTDAARLFGLGLSPLPCNARPCGNGAVGIWVPAAQASAVAAVLDQPTIEGLIPDDAIFATGPLLCFGERDFFELPAGAAAPDGTECGPGLLASFRVGAYQFLRRMTEVESYTYAAFPRGDVSGVVTETGSGRSASASAETPFGTGTLGLERRERERSAETQPSVINFASGDRQELFDFGWSIVKQGYKDPMIASQLVLVSVPAYLDEIRLEIIKGFLDRDRLPSDWTGRRREFDDLGEEPSDTDRAMLLDERVNQLFATWERRTLQLKVPPDYRALDGIVIGNSVIGGPRINAASLQQSCHAIGDGSVPFIVTIPGERLWRSTVVTLDGRKASQIEVMPNMEGILATFGEPASTAATAPEPAPASPPSRRTRDLTVWTSEGSHSVELSVCSDAGAP